MNNNKLLLYEVKYNIFIPWSCKDNDYKINFH